MKYRKKNNYAESLNYLFISIKLFVDNFRRYLKKLKNSKNSELAIIIIRLLNKVEDIEQEKFIKLEADNHNSKLKSNKQSIKLENQIILI
jgi:hypothetical protein